MGAFHEQEGTGDVRPVSEPKRILYTPPGRIPVLKRYTQISAEISWTYSETQVVVVVVVLAVAVLVVGIGVVVGVVVIRVVLVVVVY